MDSDLPTAPARLPGDVAALLTALKREPGRPRLTWYGPDGERVELSGHVLDNWVAKTANLLVEELDVGPGSTVALDLPVHWRTAVWALAAWRVGAGVVLGGDQPVDVVVTDHPGDGSRSADAVVGVELSALARRFAGGLPAGAIDAASAVMTYADVLGWAPPTDPAAVALPPDGPRFADLIARAAAGTPAGARSLLAEQDVATGLLHLLGVWAGDGSVVLLAPDVARELAADPARLERLVAGERVTWPVGLRPVEP